MRRRLPVLETRACRDDQHRRDEEQRRSTSARPSATALPWPSPSGEADEPEPREVVAGRAVRIARVDGQHRDPPAGVHSQAVVTLRRSQNYESPDRRHAEPPTRVRPSAPRTRSTSSASKRSRSWPERLERRPRLRASRPAAIRDVGEIDAATTTSPRVAGCARDAAAGRSTDRRESRDHRAPIIRDGGREPAVDPARMPGNAHRLRSATLPPVPRSAAA